MEEGEEVLITRHGDPVALTTSPVGKRQPEEARQAVRNLMTFADRHGLELTDTTVQELRQQGRRS